MHGRLPSPAEFVWVLLLVGCGERESLDADPSPRPGPPEVFVANHPLQYFVERMAVERVQVLFPVPPDSDPASWSPRVEEVARIQQADRIFLNGGGYSSWVGMATLPDRVVDTSAAYRAELLALEDQVTHTHGPEGEHEHSGTAFTTWLDPTQAIQQADAVRGALVELLPEWESEVQASFESLQSDLLALDQGLAEALEQAPPMVASHPVFQYLERRYHLDLRSVHWEPDQEPSDEQWQELAGMQARQPAQWMLWEGEPLPSVATRLQEMGLASVVFDPCANRPPVGDFFTTMQGNLERVRQARAADHD